MLAELEALAEVTVGNAVQEDHAVASDLSELLAVWTLKTMEVLADGWVVCQEKVPHEASFCPVSIHCEVNVPVLVVAKAVPAKRISAEKDTSNVNNKTFVTILRYVLLLFCLFIIF
jgi:hypothetical protein